MECGECVTPVKPVWMGLYLEAGTSGTDVMVARLARVLLSTGRESEERDYVEGIKKGYRTAV